MGVPAVGRMEERNLVGVCHIDVVNVLDVASMPDELGQNVTGDVVLNDGATWSRIYLDDDGGLFTEKFRMVQGAQLSDATMSGVIAKHRLALMPNLWSLKTGRYLVRMELRNGEPLIMGRPETGAAAILESVTSGGVIGTDRNEYRVVFSLTRRLPVPFHNGTVPEPDPGGGECPTLAELLAAEDWAAIEALLDGTQLSDAEASICEIPPDALAQLKDSAGADIGSPVIIPPGGPTTVTAPDATYTLKDSGGGTIGGGSIRSNGSANITAPDGTVKTTDASTTVMVVLSNGTANLPQSKIKYTNAAGSAAELAASNTDFASGTLRPATTVPRFTIYEPDGTTPNSYKDISTPSYTMVKTLVLKFLFALGDDTSLTLTVDSDSAGVLTAQTQDGSSGTITISINGGAFAAFSNPTTLAVSDTVVIKRTTYSAAGWVKLTGSYT